MKLLHKDHKGPNTVKTRRLNGPGMNVGISNLLADLLEPIADEMGGKAERGSTEAVLSTVDDYSQEVEHELAMSICRERCSHVLMQTSCPGDFN